MILKCENVCKTFDQTEVLRGVNLELNKGEILTLLGDSGCGKSTLLRLIAGLESVTSGIISINGKIAQNSSTFLPPQKRKIAFVFQDYALFPHLNVKQNISFGLREFSTKEQELRVDEVVNMLNIKELLKRYPHELSGGQQQRIAIARALATKPEILLLDEPFSNLDTNLKIGVSLELRKLIKDLHIGAIMVTHNRQEALSMSDKIALLHSGIIDQCDTPIDIYEKPKNLHVAKFLGDISIFEPKTLRKEPKHGQKLGIRPEHCWYEKQSGELECKVVSKVYGGENYLLHVKLKSGENIVVKVPNSADISIDEIGYINIHQEKLFWLYM